MPDPPRGDEQTVPCTPSRRMRHRRTRPAARIARWQTQRAPSTAKAAATAAAGRVLLTLATAQFLMTLDSSVMNVSMATVAEDVGTTITGIQTAITLYTLVMATLMITGGKIGTIIGRRRGVRHRLRDLRPPARSSPARPEPAGPDLRLVVPRGRRRRADPAGDRRPRGRQLRAVASGRGPTGWWPPPAPSPWPPDR